MGDNESSNCGYNQYLAFGGLPIGAFVICDSVLTIVTIWRTPQLHTNQYIFIASLAVADIMLSITYIATACIRLVWINSIVDDRNIVNNLAYGTMFSFIVLCSFHMNIIAVDRYIRIAHPFYYITNMTKQRTIKILFCSYVVCIINAGIPAVAYQGSKYKLCISIHHPLEYFYPNIGVLIININVVFVCYFKIARIAINHKKAAISRLLQTTDIEDTVVARNNRTALMRSVRFFVAMCGAFFGLCTPPFVTIWIGFYHSIPDYAMAIVAHLFPLHSFVNFAICCSLNRGFRKALQRTFADLKTGCFCKYCQHLV